MGSLTNGVLEDRLHSYNIHLLMQHVTCIMYTYHARSVVLHVIAGYKYMQKCHCDSGNF